MSKHSDWSASSMERWSVCPGSVFLSKNAPRNDTPFSKEGTVAHDLAERVFVGDLFTPEDALGAVVDGVKINQEMVDAVTMYVDFVDNLDPDHTSQTFYERTLAINKAKLPKAAELFGTADALLIEDSDDLLRVCVVDFKYGKGVAVNAEENKQLLYYGLGAVYLAMGKKKKLSAYFAKKRLELTMVIIQPRAEHPEGPIRSWTIDAQSLLEFEFCLEEAVERSLDNMHTFVSGEHCRFCPAKEICPEFNKAEQDALHEVDYLKLQANPKDLSPEEFSEALASCDVLESAIKRHRRYATKLLESGEAIPGWEIVPTRPSRQWSDESELRQALETMSLDAKRMATLATLSPAQLESVLNESDWQKVEHLVVHASKGTRLNFSGPSNEDALQLLSTPSRGA